MIINIDVKSRFELKFNKTKENDCWLWTAGKRGNNSYGGFRINTKTNPVLAHRYSYLLYKGNIPENTKVLHICDTPLCVNPNHLILGTQQDNIKDRDLKKRQRNRYSVKQLGYVSYLEGGK